jgi:hypothetical protein
MELFALLVMKKKIIGIASPIERKTIIQKEENSVLLLLSKLL